MMSAETLHTGVIRWKRADADTRIRWCLYGALQVSRFDFYLITNEAAQFSLEWSCVLVRTYDIAIIPSVEWELKLFECLCAYQPLTSLPRH